MAIIGTNISPRFICSYEPNTDCKNYMEALAIEERYEQALPKWIHFIDTNGNDMLDDTNKINSEKKVIYTDNKNGNTTTEDNRYEYASQKNIAAYNNCKAIIITGEETNSMSITLDKTYYLTYYDLVSYISQINTKLGFAFPDYPVGVYFYNRYLQCWERSKDITLPNTEYVFSTWLSDNSSKIKAFEFDYTKMIPVVSEDE